MVLSSIFFLDLKGKILLFRDYRGDIPPEAAEKFVTLISGLEEQQKTVTPVLTFNKINYVHIRHANLYILALTKHNSNVMSILLLLHRLVEVFTEYFRELEEESLRDNFVVVYELLDEMVDFGHPQTTEKNILKEYITQQSFQLDTGTARPPAAITNAVSWRSEGIKYRKNEVFLDVVESINLLVNANGSVVQSEIVGSVKVRCYLSGMPELRLGLNDRVVFEQTGRAGRTSKMVDLEDIKFHQCVRLSKFDADRTICFIPPDGDFELMSYRMTPPSMKPPIWVECIIEHWSASRIEYLIKARSQLKKKTNANNVEIIIPVPEDADTPRFKMTVGVASYEADRGAIIWTIGYFPSGKEFSMRARFGFPSVKADEQSDRKLLPISVNFEIPYYTASGIQVRYLKIVEKSGYPALPWGTIKGESRLLLMLRAASASSCRLSQWALLICFLLGLSFLSANYSGDLVNLQVKRVLYLNSPVLREEYSIVAGLSEKSAGPVHNYRVIIPSEIASKLAIITAILDGQGSEHIRMPISEVTDASCPHFARCFLISLPTPLTKDNPKISFGIGITYVDRLELVTAEAKQADIPHYRAALSPYFYSPYLTKKQKNVIMLIKEFELVGIGCPEPRNLTPSSSPSALGGIPGSSQFTCGLYQNTPALHQETGAMWVSFKAARIPFFQVNKLDRTVEFDPLNGRLLYTEDYEIEHVGHRLAYESFNRPAFLRDMSTKGNHGQTIALISLSIPKDAVNIKIRDEVGLLHTPLRRGPSPIYPEHSHVVEFQPRFPLEGGWTMAWRLTYQTPASASLDTLEIAKGKMVTRLLVPLLEIFHDVPVRSLKLDVILPSEAVLYGSTPISTTIETFVRSRESLKLPTALRVGHKQLHRIRVNNVCKEHHGFVGILFDLPRWKIYRQPCLASLAVVSFCFLVMSIFRMDWSLAKRSTMESKANSRLAKLLRDRRALLSVLDNSENSMDGETRLTMMQDVEYVGHQISQLLADETANNRDMQMITAALLRLYAEQIGKIKSILVERNESVVSRLEKDAIDLDQRVLQNEARLLAACADK